MTDSSFDIKDPKYQASQDHPPDKSSTWKIPIETDRWVLAHDAIRGEVTAMKKALAALVERGDDPLPDWAAASIETWWAGHSRHVKEHCAKEEEVLQPFVATRVKWPERLRDDHAEVDKWQGEVGSIVGGLAGKEGGAAELASAWDAYESKLLPHLREEETTALPLTRTYFAQEEALPIGRTMLESEPEATIGAIIHFMGEGRFRSEFMKQQGIPFFVWHVAFKGRHIMYETEMVSHIDALVAGKPPKAAKKSGWGLF